MPLETGDAMDGINRINQTGQPDRWTSFITQQTHPDNKEGGGAFLREPIPRKRLKTDETPEEEAVAASPKGGGQKARDFSRKMHEINSKIEALSLLDSWLESPFEKDAVMAAQYLLSQSAADSSVVELISKISEVSNEPFPGKEDLGSLREMSSAARKQLEDYLAANQSFLGESDDTVGDRILADQSAAVSSQDLKSQRVLHLLTTAA